MPSVASYDDDDGVKDQYTPTKDNYTDNTKESPTKEHSKKSDAHDTEGLKDVWYGVQIARKGWLEADDVLNTRTGSEMEEILGL